MPKTPTPPATRLRGFHVRRYHSHADMSEETEAFTCEVYRNDELIGFARNAGRGGSDEIQIKPPHAAAWQEFVAFVSSFPRTLDEHRVPRPPFEPGADALQLLRAISALERKLARSKKYRSAMLAHEWASWERIPGFFTDLVEFLSTAPAIDPDGLEPRYFLTLVIGRDNAEFGRCTPPVPSA